MCKPRAGWPISTESSWIGLACLPSWLGMMNTGWLVSIRSELFLQMKIIILEAVKQAAFLPGQPAPCN